jgi:hypothetical protein
MNLFRSSSFGKLQSLLSGYQQFSSVVSGHQTQINSYGIIQQKQPGLHRIGTNQCERPEPGRKPRVLCHASLKKVKIRKDTKPMKHCKVSYASSLLLSIKSYLYSVKMSHVLSWVLSQQNTTWVWRSNTPCDFVLHETTKNFNRLYVLLQRAGVIDASVHFSIEILFQLESSQNTLLASVVGCF